RRETRPVPRGPSVSPERGEPAPARAARAAEGHPGAGAALRAEIRDGERRSLSCHRVHDRAASGRASLARQCARTREHDPPRGAAGKRALHPARGDPPARRHTGQPERRRSADTGPDGGHQCGGRDARPGRPHRRRRRARPDPRHAGSLPRQPHPCGEHPGHLDPHAAQQAARVFAVRPVDSQSRRAARGERVSDVTTSAAPAGFGLNFGQVADLLKRSDLALAIGIMAIIVVLLLPLPPWLLDIALALSLGFSILILMTAVFIRKPLEFSSFPTILLITTMLRLALNLASTRLIL